jgi:transcriptional regulator GlxA family with amidase domain
MVRRSAKLKYMLMQIALFDGFDLLDAIAPYEALTAAMLLAQTPHPVEFATIEGPRDVPSGPTGLAIQATATLAPGLADVLIVPGAAGDVAGDGPNSVPAILGRAVETGLADAVGMALDRSDVTVATVCGGSLLLGLAGYLSGRPAVTHRLGMDVLAATGANPVFARVVDAGNLITGGGVTSGLDVGLYLVERLFGPRVASGVEQLFEYERRGTVWVDRGLAPVALS